MGVLLSSIHPMENQDLIFTYRQLLQESVGPIAKALSDLNRYCLRSSWADVADERDYCDLACATLRNRHHAQTLLAAHGKTSWPGSFGQSPYAEVFALVRLALAGQMPPRTATRVERSLHRALFDQLAPPAAASRAKLDEAGRSRRYRRILFGMREAAILTRTESDAVLRQLLNAHPGDRAELPPCCEAAANFGGTMRVLTRSLQLRSYYREPRTRVSTVS